MRAGEWGRRRGNEGRGRGYVRRGREGGGVGEKAGE